MDLVDKNFGKDFDVTFENSFVLCDPISCFLLEETVSNEDCFFFRLSFHILSYFNKYSDIALIVGNIIEWSNLKVKWW
jgi:hypothetical protein